MPFRAMDLNQATVSGNIEAVESMMRQMNFSAEMAEEYVTLVHADLGGVERLQGAQAQRCDEDSGSAQLRNVVSCPGLFHVSMANADILFRAHLKPEARHEESCLWKYIRKLRPTKAEQAKFTAKQGPGYRRMHDVARHVTWALILECWELEAQAWDASCTTLEVFAHRLSQLPTRKLAWNRIWALSQIIARKYVAGPDFQAARAKPVAQRDGLFENWQLFLQISFFDQIFDYAVKTQDVGRVLISLCDLIFAYQGAKKHKYAFQLVQTLILLAYVFPEPLRRAYLTSWIINPTGKRMGGRGVDWLVELFNLYLKQMHCGSSSNYGLQHMMNMSTLISLFKYVFDNFIVNYHITSHTTRHQGPDMKETIDELRKVIHADRAMTFTPGRTSPYEVDDVMTLGQASFMSGSAAELAAQDVEAEHMPTTIEDYD
ncbi:hypothetical protein EXIGLDRAFT_305487 [Exidia glandulosa HHB12029]|uniref:DUF6589 domain-containing protein n=1 Tax=Exidia glandulosa HHB12029 TaxID=1314781 RepID=A0A165D4T1_EXIGL|nr:hypothetical protein EXIGLDRAFT_305487 [Exidia glandulosa HHB12029]